ncbi:hypothetical protein D3C87_1936660 [compost metagenome]
MREHRLAAGAQVVQGRYVTLDNQHIGTELFAEQDYLFAGNLEYCHARALGQAVTRKAQAQA